MRRLILPLVLLATACVPAVPQDVATRAATVENSTLPAMKVFPAPRPDAPGLSNADIARDFLDLSFTLESGRALPRLTRFEEPIRVRVAGTPPPTLGPDLARLLQRLRTEAGIDIARTSGRAQLVVEAVPRSEIRANLPQAACFVVPGVASLAEYRAARRSSRVSWSKLERRETAAIFVPADAPPQEVRDCLHEELAQAIGPLNDLYRLPDSVFNDDNVHTVLTGFDMLVLRAYNDPALASGMTREEVAARLPAILARLNPAGERVAPRAVSATPRTWIDAIQTALGPGAGDGDRRAAALRALRIAAEAGWRDHRRGFSHYAVGRILLDENPEAAKTEFERADRIFATSPYTTLHRAYVASQLAAYAITRNRPDEALALLRPHLEVAARHENAALLSTLMLLRAEALDLDGRVAEGQAVRLDSLGWARYGFGADWAVRAKMREIGALNPLNGTLDGRIGRT
ncbi:DUF2927 domain-containing protein [Roseivivax isoporae]|uniref:ATP-dependent transcriptional regulator n=1 Tax=Roseivivax isoporae LMG 25204 TaxID=1449351 RepID=X7FFC1_9RHOB|nr:DUF2927 domain-containing protein [Roseivivax isoporae]ETX30724.1 hypothetical protein RISW2_07920 [Roseivivax isoporae LMG 25204]